MKLLENNTETSKYVGVNIIYRDSAVTYRVNIKSFLDYKYLLQENYMEYKYVFLPLLELVSKVLCHVFIVAFVTFGFWMQHFQIGGLGETVRHPGHHDRRISPP